MSPVPNEICYASKGHPAAGPEEFQSGTSKCSVLRWKQFACHDYSRQPGSLIKSNYEQHLLYLVSVFCLQNGITVCFKEVHNEYMPHVITFNCLKSVSNGAERLVPP